MIYFVLVLIFLIVLFVFREVIFTFLGKLLLKYNKTEIAVKILGFGAKLGHMSINYRLSFAYLLLKSGEVNEANKIFSLLSFESVKNEEKIKLCEYQALSYQLSGDAAKAIEFYEEVLPISPNESIYENLGSLYIQNGNLATALEFNKNAFEKYNQNLKILNNLAYTCLCLSDYLNAEEYYDKLFMMKPDFPECYFEYGKLLVETGYIGKGLNYVKKALDFEFNDFNLITKRQIEEYLKSRNNNNDDSNFSNNSQENFQENTLPEENNVNI